MEVQAPKVPQVVFIKAHLYQFIVSMVFLPKKKKKKIEERSKGEGKKQGGKERKSNIKLDDDKFTLSFLL